MKDMYFFDDFSTAGERREYYRCIYPVSSGIHQLRTVICSFFSQFDID